VKPLVFEEALVLGLILLGVLVQVLMVLVLLGVLVQALVLVKVMVQVLLVWVQLPQPGMQPGPLA